MEYVKRYWPLGLKIWIAFVFIQSLFFKFSTSYETQYIFGKLGDYFGMEWFADYGGYTIGTIELVASILLFTRWWAWGASIALGIITGAVIFHLFTPLGIVMPTYDSAGMQIGDDGGTLFVMACITTLCSLSLVLKDLMSDDSQLLNVVRAVLWKKK